MSGTLYTWTRICSLLFLTVLLKIVQRCDSGVVVSLRLDHFINPDGSCCIIRHGHCEPCYYEFQVCVTRQSSYHYTSAGEPLCHYGRWHTGMIKPREDSFYLPPSFPSGHPNPLKIRVPYWEGQIRMTINVKNIGKWGYYNDLVIEYTFSLTEWRPGRTELDSVTYNWLFVRYGFRLDLQYAVYCEPDYYGRLCRVHCQPPTYYDHYTCDTNTGRKICHRGFTGYNCRQKVLPTSSYPWWRTTTRRPLPPRRLTTTVAPVITSTESTSSSTTTITTPTATTNTPASTTKSPTSTTHAFIYTTRPPTSTTETPTSTPQMPISTTGTPNPTTHTATSSTLNSTTDTLTSTMDTPSSTSHTSTTTTTTDTPTSPTDTPTSTTDTPTSTTHTATSSTLNSTTDTLTSTMDTPSSTSHTSTTTTDTPTSPTDTPTSTADTPTSTTQTATSSTLNSTTYTLTSTMDTPSSTSHTSTTTTDTPTSPTDTPTSTTHTPPITTHMPTPTKNILTSTADTPASTTYTPISSTKWTTQDAKTTIIAASTAQTTPPQTITTTGKEQAIAAIRISNTTLATTKSSKPTPTKPDSSTFGPSTLIGEYVTTEFYSTNARTDANVTTDRGTYRATDSIPPHTQSSSATYLKSLTTVFDQYVTTDTVSSETLKTSSSTEYSEMKNKSSPSPTQPILSGEDVSAVPDQTTDPSVATDGLYTTDFLARTSEETHTKGTDVGESTTTDSAMSSTDSISVSSGQITRRPTPKLSKKPTDHRRLQNKTTTANPITTGNPMSTMNVTNLTLPVSVSMVTRHAPTSSISASKQSDSYTNYSDIATQTTKPISTDSKTVGSTFLHHGTSTDAMVFTDSISQTSSERASLQTVVTISNGTLTATKSTTSTSSSPPPSTSPVVATTLAAFTQARQPTGLQGNDYFPIRTMSSRVCWTWKSNDVKTYCNCGQRDLPKLPPIDAYWGTSLRTGKPKFILGKGTLN